ncbi:hypothetical protein F3Y22_tig00111798pilonHSYRG00020 [Hibiscus syriacus]|uniref:Ninja-family protein n=1 Tax=Hibiscus syriacus TaxID=106335 RepID=A0A6A2XDE9_HIBSY|nr:hypothetical protein F3Y22_tig00111798pilonHSYRG00020 [Hibiscus syriacus]
MGSQASENTSSSISSSSKEMGNLSLPTENYPRNLLQRFIPRETQASTRSEDEAEEQVELNLGLSLGGRFGVDKHAKKLKRSSSIAGSIPIFREIDGANTTPPTVPRSTLIRASSLPTETEEEWRKRKELQTLRRMAAKRRRSEKQRSSTEENKALQPNRLTFWRVGHWCLRFHDENTDYSFGKDQLVLMFSVITFIAGARSSGEARSSGSSLSWQDPGNQEATGSLGTERGETLHKTIENKGKERGNTMEDMPCVFTKGEGPNGKRVDGILYKYGKGEEVRIMCVCHGSFLSPAEFVKHAGGGDVDHPLRHIVINPSSAPL